MNFLSHAPAIRTACLWVSEISCQKYLRPEVSSVLCAKSYRYQGMLRGMIKYESLGLLTVSSQHAVGSCLCHIYMLWKQWMG